MRDSAATALIAIHMIEHDQGQSGSQRSQFQRRSFSGPEAKHRITLKVQAIFATKSCQNEGDVRNFDAQSQNGRVGMLLL